MAKCLEIRFGSRSGRLCVLRDFGFGLVCGLRIYKIKDDEGWGGCAGGKERIV